MVLNLLFADGNNSDSDDSIIGRKKKPAVHEDDGLSDLEGEKVTG